MRAGPVSTLPNCLHADIDGRHKSQIFYWCAKGGFGCPSVLSVIVCGAAEANSLEQICLKAP